MTVSPTTMRVKGSALHDAALANKHIAQIGYLFAEGADEATPEQMRFDSKSGKTEWARVDDLPAVSQYRIHANHQTFNAMCLEGRAAVNPNVRLDSATATANFNLARDLEYLHARVLREVRQPMSSFEAFYQDRSIPFGSKTHRVERVYTAGRAVWHEEGVDVPRAAASKQEEIFPVLHPVHSYQITIFDEAAASFSRRANLREFLAFQTRDAIMRLINQAAWKGDEKWSLYGVLNYPNLAQRAMSESYKIADINATTANAIVNDLNRLLNFPGDTSSDAMMPNKLAMSVRLRNALMTTPRSAGQSDTSILEYVVEKSQYLNSMDDVIGVSELKGVSASVDGMFAWNDDYMGAAMNWSKAITFLPVQRRGFDLIVPAYAGYGGMIMRNIGNNILGLASTDPA